jgi:hypothetical protein
LFLELVDGREICGVDVTEGVDVDVDGVCSRFRGAMLNVLEVRRTMYGEFVDVVVELLRGHLAVGDS